MQLDPMVLLVVPICSEDAWTWWMERPAAVLYFGQ
jgi:hypothetical protein